MCGVFWQVVVFHWLTLGSNESEHKPPDGLVNDYTDNAATRNTTPLGVPPRMPCTDASMQDPRFGQSRLPRVLLRGTAYTGPSSSSLGLIAIDNRKDTRDWACGRSSTERHGATSSSSSQLSSQVEELHLKDSNRSDQTALV